MSYLIQSTHLDSHQTVSSAILGVVPFVNRDTAHLPKKDRTIANALQTRGPVVVVSDILSVTVNSTKSSPMMTAEILLSSGHLNYMAEFAPGDHAFIWLLHNKEDFDRISNSVLSGQVSNDFNSGLKLVGRINSVRQILNTSGDGKKSFRYAVTVKGFSEFESAVYFNELLKNSTNPAAAGANDIFSELSENWKSVFTEQGMIPVNNILTFFIDVFFGAGPSEDFRNPAPGITTSPNRSFLVPTQVCKWLGIATKSEKAAAYKYADMLFSIIGIQKYTVKSGVSSAESFIPDNITINKNKPNRAVLKNALQGLLIAIPQNFNNVSMWSLLQSNSNNVLNETYCALKPFKRTVKGKTEYYLQPTFVARQIPFSTTYIDGIVKTNFLDLPRWKLHPDYPLMSYNLGNSDATRFNFWQCYVSNPELESNPHRDIQNQLLDNTSIDELDIARSGPRIHMTVASAASSAPSDTSKAFNTNAWKTLITDWYTNMHYKMSGSVTVAGIQAPIAIGDNLEIDGKVFHIEAISHSYNVNGADGKKQFTTTIDLSHGLLTSGHYIHEEAKTRAALEGNIHLPGYTDEELYINDKPIISGEKAELQSGDPVSVPADNQLQSAVSKQIASLVDGFKGKFNV
jgi:hypothetical protein